MENVEVVEDQWKRNGDKGEEKEERKKDEGRKRNWLQEGSGRRVRRREGEEGERDTDMKK
ncbi:hypothetical protein RVY68_23160 [Phocaeicola vulgatus]|uniref:Uncharacterized protein n=1 Tax=Phocaeicola vulgatus TaxID=821 RepID=A0AAE4LID6_PHOVU|nr:hypothetical protein [Phocaeicola vulgatus]